MSGKKNVFKIYAVYFLRYFKVCMILLIYSYSVKKKILSSMMCCIFIKKFYDEENCTNFKKL